MYYVGNYEKEVIAGGSTKEYDYICTPEGLSAIAVKTGGVRSLNYVHTDHLGSVRLVTAESKAIQTRYYYDAWGKQTLLSGTGITNRGYIGEEHLNDFGLLNLNARLYDPVLGRFLEMDPYVSMPDYTQAYNRYSYCLNNPLKYTDPDGEFPWLLAAFVVGKWYYDGYKANNNEWKPWKWDYSKAGFMIGYSSQGNLMYLGSGWDNSFSLALGYSSGAFSMGYLQDGIPYMMSVGQQRSTSGWDVALYPNGVIRPYEPSAWEISMELAGNSPMRVVYDFLDMFYIYGTGALGGYENARHLGGRGVSRTEFENAGIGALFSVSPFSWGARGLSVGNAAKTGANVLSKSETLRIQNAATRINKPIHVVGSRASGKAGPYSDWDYIIEGGLKNSREWSTIKNSLPGARSILDNTPRMIDIHPGPVWPGYPYITIYPF